MKASQDVLHYGKCFIRAMLKQMAKEGLRHKFRDCGPQNVKVVSKDEELIVVMTGLESIRPD